MIEGTSALPLKSAYIFGFDHGLQDEVNQIREMDVGWNLSYSSTVRRAPRARSIGPEMTPGPLCSITSSASTTRNDDTRRSAISASSSSNRSLC